MKKVVAGSILGVVAVPLLSFEGGRYFMGIIFFGFVCMIYDEIQRTREKVDEIEAILSNFTSETNSVLYRIQDDTFKLLRDQNKQQLHL